MHFERSEGFTLLFQLTWVEEKNMKLWTVRETNACAWIEGRSRSLQVSPFTNKEWMSRRIHGLSLVKGSLIFYIFCIYNAGGIAEKNQKFKCSQTHVITSQPQETLGFILCLLQSPFHQKGFQPLLHQVSGTSYEQRERYAKQCWTASVRYLQIPITCEWYLFHIQLPPSNGTSMIWA